MSFRSRLTLFFVLIVVVPMASVAVVLFRLIDDNERGKADAQVSARQEAAIGAVEAARQRADAAAVDIGADVRLATALRRDQKDALRERAQTLLRRERVKRIAIVRDGRTVVDVGAPTAVFPAVRRLQGAEGEDFGRLEVSSQGPREYADLIARATKLQVAVLREDQVLATTIPEAEDAELPFRGEVELGGRGYRTSTFTVPGFLGARARVVLLEPEQRVVSEVRSSRTLAAAILLSFFALAFAFAMLVSRSLQGQIGAFLDAAKRLGSGDFSAKVPTAGRDEFAALGQEFNKMAATLEERLAELAKERARLQGAMRRIGETFAANLDRDALLEIVVETAMDGVGAHAGRAMVRPEPAARLEAVAARGDLDALTAALAAAEAQALETAAAAESSIAGVVALAQPMRQADGAQSITGTVAVARRGQAFSAADRELFEYLAAQASVSVENVGLHETVERQAVTDELTGLSNRRRFDDVLASEAERSRRFGQPLALLLLDIDDFKKVNDTYGHQQGDDVLREVSRILHDSCREIDEPARYGGEELAAVLPGTDLEGAYQLAERVRVMLAERDIPMRPGAGRTASMRVTASFGVATMPATADDAGSLVASADEALYRAKGAGKNRVERGAAMPRVPGD